MMKQSINNHITLLILSALMAVGICSCVDDDTVFYHGVDMTDEALVNIELAYEPFTDAVISSRAEPTEAPNGDVMADVSDIILLAYDIDGKLLPDYPVELNFTDRDIKDEPRENKEDTSTGDIKNDNTSDGSPTDETSTKCINKSIKLYHGKYYLVAVANMGKYTLNADGIITTNKTTKEVFDEKGKDSYDTLDKLRKLQLNWDDTGYVNNREMCGYFTNPQSVPSSSSDFEPVTIDKEGMTLHTWLRRAASKVTVSFDGSGLRESVKIYIKDVKICDIAGTCSLGFGKEAGKGENGKNYNNSISEEHGSLIDNGNVITFGQGDDHTKWPLIAKGSPYIYENTKTGEDKETDEDTEAADRKPRNLHAHNAPSLFFYENMQGLAEEGKGPVADLINGGVANPGKEKEGKKYGTYIEVSAYYQSEASGNISSGNIKYRFLLGKDAVKDCNAERNYHYKVTLKFNGNANEYSWHIDFKTQPGQWDVPQPWYVSYLYNHASRIPFKYTPPKGKEVVRFEAEIIENPWEPDLDENIPLGPDNQEAYDEKLNKYDENGNRILGNGFLSLKKVSKIIIKPSDCSVNYQDSKTYPLGHQKTGWQKLNHEYFTGAETVPEADRIDRSKRTFFVDGTEPAQDANDPEAYTYQRRNEDMSVAMEMPLFTRARVLIKDTGYSGNNPYVGYTRTAKIKVTPYVRTIGKKDETPVAANTKNIEVVQVRRIVNPKGVYRDAGNNEDFHVHLLRLPGDNADEFEDFKSDGPWMAEVIGDKNFITLDGRDKITGSTNSSIKFTIRFNKLNNDNTVRNAIVRVLYHTYTCTHLIFVRQGYGAQAICEKAVNNHSAVGSDGNRTPDATPVKWRTFNRISKNKDAEDPRDEGSLFKFGNADKAIDAFNNCYGDKDKEGEYDGVGIYKFPQQTAGSWSEYDTNSGKYYLYDDATNKRATTQTNWSDIKPNTAGFPSTGDWSNMTTMDDFEQLYSTPNINFGYGVLYADGATSTQKDINYAYGYYREDPNCKVKGMRGIFAYYYDRDDINNKYTAKSIFFPIGRSGYGHRKEGRGKTEIVYGKGILRYSCGGHNNRSETFKVSAPLFSALYYRPGAIYYAKTQKKNCLIWDGSIDKENCIGLDFNYFTFDVNAINSSNTQNEAQVIGHDACFVRFKN